MWAKEVVCALASAEVDTDHMNQIANAEWKKWIKSNFEILRSGKLDGGLVAGSGMKRGDCLECVLLTAGALSKLAPEWKVENVTMPSFWKVCTGSTSSYLSGDIPVAYVTIWFLWGLTDQ